MKTLVLTLVAALVLAVPLAAYAASSRDAPAAPLALASTQTPPSVAAQRADPPILRVQVHNNGSSETRGLLTIDHGGLPDYVTDLDLAGGETYSKDWPATESRYSTTLRGLLVGGVSGASPNSCESGIMIVTFEFEETLLTHSLGVGHHCQPLTAKA